MFYPKTIMSKFYFCKSSKGYHILCLALEEAMKLYPHEFSMDQLCQRIAERAGGKNPKSLQRILNRTVESIWKNKNNGKLLEKIYQYPVDEKISAKDFICSFVEYSVQHPGEVADPSYMILRTTLTPNIFLDPDGKRCTLHYLDTKPLATPKIDVMKGA